MAFGRIGDAAWLFGLPGNPVAVMVTFYEFVRDALLKLWASHRSSHCRAFACPASRR
jgi:molybdopterin biosynthesis enzyme